MWTSIFTFEIKQWLNKPASYIFLLFFLASGIFAMAGQAGVFGAATTSSTTLANSPAQIMQFVLFLQKLLLFLVPIFIGGALNRDFKGGVYNLLYTFPIRKLDYWLGKFLSAYLLLAITAICMVLGLFLGTFIPGTHPDLLTSNQAYTFLYPLFIFLLPNLFILAAVAFVLVANSRNHLSAFVWIIVVLIIEELLTNIAGSSSDQSWIFYLELLGQQAIFRSIAVSTNETALLPITWATIYNRLLWTGISLLILFMGFRSFEWYPSGGKSWFPKKSPLQKDRSKSRILVQAFPATTYQHTFKVQVQKLRTLANIEFKYIIRQLGFWVIAGAGMLFMLFALSRASLQNEFRIYPVTWEVLNFPSQVWQLVITILTFLYAGVLIHRARNFQMDQLEDSTATPGWVFMGSKFLAIFYMQASLLLILFIAGLMLQVSQGFYEVNLSLYGLRLFGTLLPYLLIWTMAAFFVHTLIANAYLGFFLLLIGSIGVDQLHLIGLEHPVFAFNYQAELQYSDLSGFDHQLPLFFLYKLYWGILGILLLLGAGQLWRRGTSIVLQDRIQSLQENWNFPKTAFGIFLVAAFLSLGFWIYNHDQDIDQERWTATNEINYKAYEKMALPRIKGVKVEVDIFPARHQFELKGQYTLVNQTDQIIDTLLVNRPFQESCTYPSNNSFKIIAIDDYSRMDLLRLNQSLMPGDSLEFSFTVKSPTQTIFHTQPKIKKNGSFLRSSIFPRFGYRNVELKDTLLRTKYGLGPAKTVIRKHENYQAKDADWVHWEAIVSTSQDQIALAPGELIAQWETGDRKFFHYQSAKPMKFSVGIFSGVYEVLKDTIDQIPISILYQKTHNYNLERLKEGIKATLAHNNEAYGPAQFNSLNLVEFPATEGSFATLYGNLVPFSELYFITNIRPKTDDLDLPFYVTAHELSHHWWGHQLIPAKGPGAKMLTESLADYSALQILGQQYGLATKQQFLAWNLEQYTRARKQLKQAEPPLIHSGADQDFINYRKGSIVFNELAVKLGKDQLHQLLKQFLMLHNSKQEYPTAEQLVEFLEAHAPAHLKEFLNEQFRQVQPDRLQIIVPGDS